MQGTKIKFNLRIFILWGGGGMLEFSWYNVFTLVNARGWSLLWEFDGADHHCREVFV